MTESRIKTSQHRTMHDRRAERQIEAEARKAERAKRTPEEQLRVLAERGVTSGLEVDRLTAKIGEERRKKFKKEAA